VVAVILLGNSVALADGFLKLLAVDIFTAPRVYSMTFLLCKIPAAELTLGLSVPSMVARKSWVMGSDPESTRS
jgi:hypothetical protein